MAGKPLARVPLEELDRAGKLGVYAEDGKRLTLPALPPVPLEYSINKLDTLYQWFGPVKDQLAEKLSKELLRYETPTQLVEAIAPRGPVERSIASQLESATNDWREFVRVNHMNSPYELDDEGARAVLKEIASSLRSTLSDFVQSSAAELSSYYSSVEAERMAQKLGREAQSFKPLFGNMPANVSVRAEDGFSVFNSLVKSMLDLPSVADEVVNTIYLKPIEGCRWEKEPPRGGEKGESAVPPGESDAERRAKEEQRTARLREEDKRREAEERAEEERLAAEDAKKRAEAARVGPVGTKSVAGLTDKEIQDLIPTGPGSQAKQSALLSEYGVSDSDIAVVLNNQGANRIPAIIRALKKKAGIASSIDQHHPYNAHIHHTIKDIAGSYPSHYMAEHTRRDLTESAPYKGDVDATYASYHTFANAHPMPAAAPVGRLVRASAAFPEENVRSAPPSPIPIRGDLAPVGCGHEGGRKKKKGEEEDVRSALPPLIPIRGDLAPVGCGHDGRRKKKDEEEKMEAALPPLIPIRDATRPFAVESCHGERHKKRDEKSARDMESALPPLIPIRGDAAPPVRPLRDLAGREDEEGIRSALPPLIPLGEDLARVECGMRKKKGKEEEEDIRSALPPLVPIQADVAQKMRNRLVRVEAKGHGFAGLPEVDDLF